MSRATSRRVLQGSVQMWHGTMVPMKARDVGRAGSSAAMQQGCLAHMVGLPSSYACKAPSRGVVPACTLACLAAC